MPEEIMIKAGTQYTAQVLVSVVVTPDVDMPMERLDQALAEDTKAALEIYSTIAEVVPFAYPSPSFAEMRAVRDAGYTETADLFSKLHPAAVLLFVSEGIKEKWFGQVDLTILTNLLQDRLSAENKRKFFLEI